MYLWFYTQNHLQAQELQILWHTSSKFHLFKYLVPAWCSRQEQIKGVKQKQRHLSILLHSRCSFIQLMSDRMICKNKKWCSRWNILSLRKRYEHKPSPQKKTLCVLLTSESHHFWSFQMVHTRGSCQCWHSLPWFVCSKAHDSWEKGPLLGARNAPKHCTCQNSKSILSF